MAAIEVPDIRIRKNSVWSTWRGGAVAAGGFKAFGAGGGVFHDGNRYALDTPAPTYSLALNKYLLDAGSSYSTQYLTVTAIGGGWSLQSKPDWVTVTPGSGAAGGTAITLGIAENTGAERSGSMVFVHSADGSITATLSISQTGKPVYITAGYRWDAQTGIQGYIEASEVVNTTVYAHIYFMWGSDAFYDGGMATINPGDTRGYGTPFNAPSAADPKDVYTEDGSPAEYNGRPVLYQTAN
jgi:hypothetical protein